MVTSSKMPGSSAVVQLPPDDAIPATRKYRHREIFPNTSTYIFGFRYVY